MEQKSIRGTRTEENLLKSFAGESQARGRYTIFADVARQEGYEQIAAIFLETAEQELAHARRFFSYLDEGMLEITASYPADRSVTQPVICARPPPESMRNGPTCTSSFHVSPQRKALKKSPSCSRTWLRSNRATKSAISGCSIASLQAPSLKATTTTRNGNAATADMSTVARKPPADARHASKASLF